MLLRNSNSNLRNIVPSTQVLDYQCLSMIKERSEANKERCNLEKSHKLTHNPSFTKEPNNLAHC